MIIVRPAMRHLICASIPRSGQHLFKSMIQNYLGRSSVDYCERMESGQCCGELPCIHAVNGQRYAIRKTHDSRLGDAQNDPNAVYVVLYRDPAPQTQSDAERAQARGLADFSDLTFSRWWCAKHAIYMIDFLRKWLPLQNAIVIRHDQLVEAPLAILQSVFSTAGWPLENEKRLVEAVANALAYKGGSPVDPNTPAVPYNAREITASDVVPLSYLAAVDNLVRSEIGKGLWAEPPLTVEPDLGVQVIFGLLRNPTPRGIALCANQHARRDALRIFVQSRPKAIRALRDAGVLKEDIAAAKKLIRRAAKRT